jgi:putative ABC transport system permease protein
MLYLAIPTLRARWPSFVGVLVTIAAAVALITATGALLESGIRRDVPPERLSGADIVVSGNQSISERRGSGDDAETISIGVNERIPLAADTQSLLASVPGVESVVADVSFGAAVLGSDGSAVAGPAGGPSLGHAWSGAALTPFTLLEGHGPADSGEIVVDSALAKRASLHVGDDVSVLVAGERVDAHLVGLAESAGGELRQQSAIFFDDSTALAHYGRTDSVDLLGIAVARGADVSDVADAVRRSLGDDVSVLTGNDRGRAEFLESSDASVRLIAISGSLGGIGLFVAVLVIAGMLSLFVRQRQREIGLLRAMGATPRQVRRMISRETMIVTSLGASVGVWPGLVLASYLASGMRDRGLLPGTVRVEPGIWPVVAAVGAALVVALAASFAAARRAGRVRPIEALADAAGPTRSIGWLRAALGLAAAAGTGVLTQVAASVSAPVAPAVTLGVFATAILAVGLLAPVLVRIGVWTLGLVIGRLLGPGGFLADASSRHQGARLASAVTPLALTIGIAGMTLFQQSTLDAAAEKQGEERLVAEHVLAAGGPGLPVEAVEELASATPGAAIGMEATTVYAGYELDPYATQAVTPGRLDEVVDLDVTDGTLEDLAPDQVALSTYAAGSLDAQVGEKVELRLGDGTAAAPVVAAVFDRSLGFGDVVLPWQSAGEHLGDRAVSTVLVSDRGDTAGTTDVLEKFQAEQSEVEVGGREIVAAAADANAETQAWVNYVLLGMVILFAAFALLNTLMLAVAGRVREFGLLRLVGGTRRQVLGMMRLETATVVLIGSTLGALVAAVTVMPFAKAVSGSFRPDIALLPAACLVGGTALLVLVGNLLPTRMALRTRPVDAIGIRE